MIRTEKLVVKVGTKVLLDGIDLSFASGKINLVIGPNGAGKSTLIRSISGQLTPTSGRAMLGDQSVHALSLRSLAACRAVLSQHVEIPFPLSSTEVVMMGRYPHFIGKPGAHDIQAVNESMAMFKVSHLADRNYQTLSGGEKQRVNFARVLCQIWYRGSSPRYLLLDEPLTFLDVHYQFEFMHRIVELAAAGDLTVVGVVHDLNLAARFGDQLVLLNEGKVLAAGTREEVLTHANIKKAFQIEPRIHRDPDGGLMYLVF